METGDLDHQIGIVTDDGGVYGLFPAGSEIRQLLTVRQGDLKGFRFWFGAVGSDSRRRFLSSVQDWLKFTSCARSNHCIAAACTPWLPPPYAS